VSNRTGRQRDPHLGQESRRACGGSRRLRHIERRGRRLNQYPARANFDARTLSVQAPMHPPASPPLKPNVATLLYQGCSRTDWLIAWPPAACEGRGTAMGPTPTSFLPDIDCRLRPQKLRVGTMLAVVEQLRRADGVTADHFAVYGAGVFQLTYSLGRRSDEPGSERIQSHGGTRDVSGWWDSVSL